MTPQEMATIRPGWWRSRRRCSAARKDQRAAGELYRVQSLRHYGKIPCHKPDGSGQAPEGELLNVMAAARELKIAPSTLLRWLDDGLVPGEQVTPAAPWRIRLTG